MPVLIVSSRRRVGRALEQSLVESGMLAMTVDSPAEALATANVLRFRLAVFLDPIDEQALEAMRQLHARHGMPGLAVTLGRDRREVVAPAPFVRSLWAPAPDETVLQHIREMRGAARAS